MEELELARRAMQGLLAEEIGRSMRTADDEPDEVLSTKEDSSSTGRKFVRIVPQEQKEGSRALGDERGYS